MQGKYGVFVRDLDGTLIHRINDYVSLRILMTLNDSGSWSIKSTTTDPCPFDPGMGIITVRNDKFLYGGVVNKIQDKMNAKTGLYTWEVSGVGDLGYLSRRLCYVDPSTGDTTARNHYRDSGDLALVVERLISRNLGEDAMEARREPIITSNVLSTIGVNTSVELRFQNLLKAVVTTCRKSGYNIRPMWNKSLSKIYYELFVGVNRSQEIVFTEQLNNILGSEFIAVAPEGNAIVGGGRGEMTERSFAFVENANSIEQWGRIEKFADGRNEDDIDEYASQKLEEHSENLVGYSCTASDNDNAPQFGIDYDLGDIVSMKIGSTFIAAEVQQVEITVSEGKETISPKFGTVAVGKFREIFAKLSNIRDDVDELLGAEIE